MSGLSYFDNGGSSGSEETTLQTKPSAGKGKYGLPTLTTNVPVSTGVLTSMEQLYQDKLAQQQGFMEAMKDAAAWWSGGIAGPAEALSRRSKEREEQESNLFQIQSQIAQYKAAQEAQKQFEKDRASGKLYGDLSGGTSGVTTSQMFGMSPEIRTALMNAKTQAEADKIYAEYAKKKAEVEAGPEFDVPKIPVVVWNEEKGEWERDVISPRQLRANPGKYLDEQGRTISAPAPAPAAPAPAAPAPAAPAPAAPATKPVNYTFDELSPAQKNAMKTVSQDLGLQGDVTERPDAAELFNNLPLEKRKAVFDSLDKRVSQLASAEAPTKTDVTAPTIGPAAPKPPARPPRPTAGELERKGEVEKQVSIAAEQERLKSDKIERDKFVAEADPTKLSERKIRAERVQQLVLEDPTIVGVLTQPNVKSAIQNVISQGLSTPSGTISIQGLSEAIYATLPSTISLEKRREIAGYIAQMELDASQVMNGQGQISDSERQILRAAAISIEDPAEVVYKKAKMMQARQETLQKLKEVYGDGAQFTRNFQAFKNDPKYLQITKEYEDRLRNIAKEEVKIDRSMVGKIKGPQAQPKSKGVAPFADPDQERRYQEWKRSQGK